MLFRVLFRINGDLIPISCAVRLNQLIYSMPRPRKEKQVAAKIQNTLRQLLR